MDMHGCRSHRILPVFLSVFVMNLSAHRTGAGPSEVSREEAIMGTRIAVELWAADHARGDALITRVMDEMRRVDELMSTLQAHEPGLTVSTPQLLRIR